MVDINLAGWGFVVGDFGERTRGFVKFGRLDFQNPTF